MKTQLYRILDKMGYELPAHYSGRDRTKEEADRLISRLNVNAKEDAPYRADPSYIVDMEPKNTK